MASTASSPAAQAFGDDAADLLAHDVGGVVGQRQVSEAAHGLVRGAARERLGVAVGQRADGDHAVAEALGGQGDGLGGLHRASRARRRGTGW
ncbi:hypothetical protein [Saccharopolyspora erythraea]|uniref:hypothetical protein n=1 Tax=Saccharopolyspora erythraea TaxID=1836 RepID=UPI0018DE0AA8|nr:hypothetical protein [Saccharopolyspora erythraea]